MQALRQDAQGGKGSAENYFPIFGSFIQLRHKFLQKLQRFCLGFVHFPICGNDDFPHRQLNQVQNTTKFNLQFKALGVSFFVNVLNLEGGLGDKGMGGQGDGGSHLITHLVPKSFFT